MPPATYKPLFNRRYLYWLMWIIAIAIVLLNVSGREKERYPLVISWSDNPSHWRLAHPDQNDRVLTALLPVAPGWNRQNTLLKSNTQASVQQWLSLDSTVQQLQTFNWQVTLHSGTFALRLVISLHQAPSSDQLEWLRSALQQLHLVESPEQQRWIAAWQLDQRQPEQRLLAELESWLYPTNTLNSNWTLLLASPDVKTPSQSFETFERMPSSLANARTSELEGFVSQAHTLAAWEVSLSQHASDLAKHRVAIAAIQLALNTLPNRPDYRLIWNPLPPKSFFAIIVQESFDQPLGDQLRALMLDPNSDRLISKAKENVIGRHTAPSQSIHEALEWFEISVLLGFSSSSDSDYQDALVQLSNAEVREHLETLLHPKHQLSITLKPY